MLKIQFSAEDLARVRMTAGLGLAAETVFALEHFAGRGGTGSFRGWYKQVRGRLGERLPAIEQLVAEHPPVPGLLWLMGSPEAHAAPEGAELSQVRATISSFSRVAVEPYWRQVRRQLELEHELRMRVAATKGFDGLLQTLHPTLSWKYPVLENSGPVDGEMRLDGRGVLLAPSLFLMKRQCAIIENERFSRLPAIVFPASQDVEVELQLAEVSADERVALGALIGHSRAGVLEVLAEGCTTGELSRRMGLSLAGASKHATVLRQAGLVTTLRHRNTAFHVATPLGQALLRGRH